MLSDATARGIWAMEDVLRWPPDGPLQAQVGYGHYHEEYVKVGGRWLIAHSRLTGCGSIKVEVWTARSSLPSSD